MCYKGRIQSIHKLNRYITMKGKKIIKELQTAYWKEIETVMNYLAHSVNLDGIRAQEIQEILREEVQDEMGHAQQLANRIKDMDGTVEGSFQFTPEQDTAQPVEDTTDLKSVINGVINAEEDAIAHYKKIIEMCDGVDFVTQDLCISLQSDEEKHLRLFRGFLKGIEADESKAAVIGG